MIVFNKQSTNYIFLNGSLHFSSMNPVIVDTLPKGCQLMERFEGKELKFRYYVNPEMGLLFKEVEGKYQQLKTMNGEVSLKFVQGKQLSHIKWSRILKNINARQEEMTIEELAAKIRSGEISSIPHETTQKEPTTEEETKNEEEEKTEEETKKEEPKYQFSPTIVLSVTIKGQKYLLIPFNQ